MKNKYFIKWLLVVAHIFVLLIVWGAIYRRIPQIIEENNREKNILIIGLIFSGLMLYTILNNLVFLWYLEYSKNLVLSLQVDFLRQEEKIQKRENIIIDLSNKLAEANREVERLKQKEKNVMKK